MSRTSGARFPDPDDKPATLKRYSVAVPVTTIHYIDVEAIDAEEAEAQAIEAWRRGDDFDTDKPLIDFDDINVTEVK
jgi:hypothetical protein